MAWNELDLHPRILDAVKKARFASFPRILTSSTGELERQTKLSSKDVEALLVAVSQAIVKHPSVTVLDMVHSQDLEEPIDKKLSIGCEILNKFLRGGILINRITEISGESASGKTQLCLQLCLTSQLPISKGGLNSGVAYICTEDAFPTRRLQQMIQSFREKHPEIKKKFGDKIFINHVADFDSLKDCLTKQLPALLNQGQAKLVIVDSIAAIFRREYDSTKPFQRSQELQTVGAKLHQLCYDFHATIVCINQVSGVFDIGSNPQAEGRNFVPSLGLTWASMVNCRLVLSRTEARLPLLPISHSQQPQTSTTMCNPQTVVRNLEVDFAPNLPRTTCQFIVDFHGVKGL